jgi:hypothetical protein
MGACANSVSGDSTRPTGTISIVISLVSSAASGPARHESAQTFSSCCGAD